ncbi:unnamed protein product [Mortierella alpina]
MGEHACIQISVLTLNCWGLFSRHRKHRIRAIGTHLLDPTHGYDIVGLQEVWEHTDFLILQDLTKDVFPYAKHWTSGLFGSGLVVLSKHPILSTSLRRFALNGDPMAIHRGDWWDGKSCASAVLAHPIVGEIEVFNTHLHATYHEAGTPDPYLGCRLVQAWEMAGLFRTACALGRHVIALGDFNSAPNTLVIKLLTQFGGLTDSWHSLHPLPLDRTLVELEPEESQNLLGITCDTPLNSWTSHSTWKNSLTGDPVGERLDYILYKKSPTMDCSQVQVVLQERTVATGTADALMHLSDHFGVHAIFDVRRMPRDTMSGSRGETSEARSFSAGYSAFRIEEAHEEVLGQVLVVLQQYSARMKTRSERITRLVTPLLGCMALALCIQLPLSVDWPSVPRWRIVIGSLVLSMFSSAWVISLGHGFLYGGESSAAFLNAIQEVELALAWARCHQALKGRPCTNRAEP